MKCKIIGYAHLQGKSKKTGNDYNFYTLSVTYQPEKGFTGERVQEISVDPQQVQGIENCKLPVIAEIYKDFSNRITVVM